MSGQLRFDGRVALVTGAGHGLGRAHALMLASRGARVVVNDLGGAPDGSGADAAVASAVVDEIRAAGGEAVANADSVADPDGARAIVEQALSTWGRLDVVVNNAGITGHGSFAEPQMRAAVVGTHLFGTGNVLRAALPHMLERDYGRIVNTASSSFLGTPHAADYASAKGGIIGLSRVLATDHRDTNVRINVLMPVAHTRMFDRMTDRVYVDWLRRWFQPEKVAAFVAYLCSEEVAVSGETFIAGGGRAARVLFATTRGHVEADPTPESFRDHFDEVMAGEDQRLPTSGQGDLIRYAELLGDPGPFAGQV